MKVSIVIRSKNEERFIGEVLQRVLAQEFSASYEVIVLDSGSQDCTREIVRGFPVRLEMLPAEKFTFGFALNYGVTLAQGEYLVFLSAHCLPRERSWLRELTLPLETNSCVAATYGRQEPLKGVNPLEEIGLERIYTLQEGNTVQAPFSNANSAIRRQILQCHPFDEEITGGEDFLWAYLLPPPYTVQYVHAASVFHSHPLRLRYWSRRWYIEGLMVPYLERLYGAPDPWAESGENPSSLPKWGVCKRMGATMLTLLQRKEFTAFCRYPLYGLARVYFSNKGKKAGARLYQRRTASLSLPLRAAQKKAMDSERNV